MSDVLNEVLSIFENELPEAKKNLLNSFENLEKIATYCDYNYHQADDKKVALEETKSYTVQSLASVVYQISTLTSNLLNMLDLQNNHLTNMESSMNHISQKITIHKEKVARREIGSLAATKPNLLHHKILIPANPEKPVKYVRKAIDYSILDNIGHGVKTSTYNTRIASLSGIYNEVGISASCPQIKSQNSLHTISRHGNSNLNLGTLSKSSKEYRTPIPVVPPPQVPSNYASNYSQICSKKLEENKNFFTLPNINQSGQISLQNQYLIQKIDLQPQIEMVHPINQINNLALPSTVFSPPPTPPPPPPVPSLDFENELRSSSPPLPSPPSLLEEPIYNYEPLSVKNNYLPEYYIEKVVALYDYNAVRNDELSFKENSIIYVTKKNDDDWYEGVLNGVTGCFPGNYVEPCSGV